MSRKLRLMLIDDRPVTDLETQHLTLQKVPYGNQGEDPSLGTWVQHLWLWSDDLFPQETPDLILIDCRFEDDYQYVPMSEALKGHDPRGLLHGTVFLSRMFGRDRFHPFGFAVYSMDASGFKNDAYAQTFMGFLLAMRDSTLPEGAQGFIKGRRAREVVHCCAEELGKTVSQNPATAWGPALAMYRQRLAEVADLQAYIIDKDTWLKAVDAAKRKDFEAFDSGLFLNWRRFGGEKDSVELRSLFADLLENQQWSETANSQALEWLENLLVVGDYLDDALDWAHKVLEDEQDPDDLPVPRGRDLHGNKLTRFFHACTGVLAWYENRVRGEVELTSGTLLAELGLQDKQLERYFKPLLGLSWGRVVDQLDEGYKQGTWPFPNQWEIKRVAQDWAENIRNEKFPFG